MSVVCVDFLRPCTAFVVLRCVPEWTVTITHQEEHAIGKGVGLKGIHDDPELLPGLHGSQINESVESPLGFLG